MIMRSTKLYCKIRVFSLFLILVYNAGASVHSQTKHGDTALHYAIMSGRDQVSRFSSVLSFNNSFFPHILLLSKVSYLFLSWLILDGEISSERRGRSRSSLGGWELCGYCTNAIDSHNSSGCYES